MREAPFLASLSFNCAHIWHVDCDGFVHSLPNELQELIRSCRIAHVNDEASPSGRPSVEAPI